MSGKRIMITPNGGTGNRMFQHMLAQVIQRRVPDAEIVGSRLPEWGISTPEPPTEWAQPRYKINTHDIPLEQIIKQFGRGRINTVLIRSPSTRLAYYEGRLHDFRKTFSMPRAEGIDFSRTLVMHVRLNKMSKYGLGGMQGVHRDYPVLPLAWYQALIATSGLEPLFVGEFGGDPVTLAMKERFPYARFIRNQDPMADYRILYSAEHVVINASTFSWLAAWLSPYSAQAILPIAGFLNPRQRPDIDLLPVKDPRFSFYDFPVEHWTASSEQVEAVIRGSGDFCWIASEAVERKYARPVADEPGTTA